MRPGDASEENIQLLPSWVDLTQPTFVRRNQLTSGGSVVPKWKWINSFAEIPCALGHGPPIVISPKLYIVFPAASEDTEYSDSSGIFRTPCLIRAYGNASVGNHRDHLSQVESKVSRFYRAFQTSSPALDPSPIVPKYAARRRLPPDTEGRQLPHRSRANSYPRTAGQSTSPTPAPDRRVVD